MGKSIGVRAIVGCVASFVVLLMCAFQALAGAFVAIGTRNARDQDKIERRLRDRGVSVEAKEVRTSAHIGSHARGQTVYYQFGIPDGEQFQGTYDTNEEGGFPPGSMVQVLYAPDDPMVNRKADDKPFSGWTFAMISGGMALVVPVLILFTRNKSGAPSPINKWRGMAILGVAFAVGYGLGMLIPLEFGNTYTVQQGSSVFSGMGVESAGGSGYRSVSIEHDDLRVDGRLYGVLPNHAHVWVKPDEVLINGRTAAQIR